MPTPVSLIVTKSESGCFSFSEKRHEKLYVGKIMTLVIHDFDLHFPRIYNVEVT